MSTNGSPLSRPIPLVRPAVGEASMTLATASNVTSDQVPDCFDKISSITDWYVPEDERLEVIVYPGARVLPKEWTAHAKRLLALAKESCYRTRDLNLPMEIFTDYRIEIDGGYLRGHRQRTVEGVIHILRVAPKTVPEIKSLGLPDEVRQILCSQELGDSGGLVIVCGAPGHGKSTSCAAIILDRVRRFGSFCLTVEDPPEFPLSGVYKHLSGRSGKIIQIHANGNSFSGDLKDALRCYPSNMRGSILFVGEVRDANSASQVLLAAANGQLVFMTSHAGDPILGIERLLALAKGEIQDSKEASSLLASSLRGVVHQSLTNGKLTVKAIFSMTTDSEMGAVLRSGDVRMLSSEISRQQTLIATGGLVKAVLTGQKNR